MKTEAFTTQEEILNYLGKKNDRNLIRRKMMKGEIYKEDGMYYLVVDESNDVGQLKGRIKVLEEDVSRLVEENKKIKEKSE